MIIPDWLLNSDLAKASKVEKNILWWLMTNSQDKITCIVTPEKIIADLRMSIPDVLHGIYALSSRIVIKPLPIEWYDVVSDVREHDPWVQIRENLDGNTNFEVEVLVFMSETHWRYKTMVQRRLVCDGIIDRTIEKQNRESDELK